MPKGKFFYLLLGLIGGLILFWLGSVLVQKTICRQDTKPAVSKATEVVKKEKLPAVEKKKADVPVAPVSETTIPSAAPLPQSQAIAALKPEFQKGMIYVSWTEYGYSNINSASSMEQMVSLGVEWVSLVTTWYQDKANSTKIYPIKGKTPSDESLIFAIRKLHELKLKVMLKPHLDLVQSEGLWRGDIGFDSPDDWQAWFDSYSAFMLHYAEIAAKENVGILCLGTELTRATLEQPDKWRALISKVREIYKGALTYAANWNTEYEQIKFWDALDYAGIDPYFPLVCSMKPSVEDLKGPWQDWLNNIEAWQKTINKPVLFTEIGYKSTSDATDEPWQHMGMGQIDLQLQANCYQALLDKFWDRPWFYGIYWWHWGASTRMGGELDRGFTPQNKPAQEIIKEWYSKPVSEKTY